MSEAVIFLFSNITEVLVEVRKIDGKEVMLIPGGSIELEDKNISGDYRENALVREVNEELAGKVEIVESHQLGSIYRDDTRMKFYVYLISKWKGETPEYTIENGRKHARLRWLNIDEAVRDCWGIVSKYTLEKAKSYQMQT